MSQKLSETVQPTKQLTFQEICPLWYEILTTAPTRGYKQEFNGLSIGKSQFCVVGEAYHFNSKCSGDYGCRECRNFSMTGRHTFIDLYYEKRKPYTPEELDNHPIVRAFVDHWNECHVTLTGPLPL